MISQRKGEWVEIIVPRQWDGYTIEYLLKEVWHVPKGFLHQFRTDKRIKVNGEIYPMSKELHMDEKLLIYMFPEEEYGVVPSFSDIDILYEDNYLLVINKFAGTEVHPTGLGQTNTLANFIAYYFFVNGIKTKIRHIHRLDKDTTGAILFAKNGLTGALLDRSLENRTIKRTYIALVHGKVKDRKGKIIRPIGRDRHHPTRRIVSSTGQDAVTYFEVLEYYPKEDITLVKLELETGRTHQIRVHMSYMGHSLIGDDLYGGSTDTIYSRQALHAIKITFPHPITNELIICTAPFTDNPPIFADSIIKKIHIDWV
ncbi:MAG: RluA family pseudouridine synthase [Vulcanibacillus sp.]